MIMESLSIRIQKIILEQKKTKKEIAEACGWTSSSFANKLKRDSWSQTDLQKLANALKTTITVSYSPEDTDEI